MEEGFDSSFESCESVEPESPPELMETDLGEMLDAGGESAEIFEGDDVADGEILGGLDAMPAENTEFLDDAGSEDFSGSFETYDFETAPETGFSVDPEKVGEFVSAKNPYAEQWESFSEEFSGGSNSAEAWDSLKDVPFARDLDLNDT